MPLSPASLFHLTFKLEATKCTKGKGDAPHITGLWDVGEAGGGQLVGKALWHAWMSQRLVHQNKREHFQQPILDILLQLWNLTAQVIQHSC